MRLPFFGSNKQVLGVSCIDKKIHLILHKRGFISDDFYILTTDRYNSFKKATEEKMTINTDEFIDVAPTGKNTRVSLYKRTSGGYGMFFTLSALEEKKLVEVQSFNLTDWEASNSYREIHEQGCIVENYTYQNQNLLIYGDEEVRSAFVQNGIITYNLPAPLLEARSDRFDSAGVRPIHTWFDKKQKGLFLLYETQNGNEYAIGAAFLDAKNPQNVLWRTDDPLVTRTVKEASWSIGACVDEDTIHVYITDEKNRVHVLNLPYIFSTESPFFQTRLKKHTGNPILAPRDENSWESVGAFNPAALEDDGKVHLLYRALGPSGFSSIGYAVSKDGLSIDERSNEPIYKPRMPFEGVLGRTPASRKSASGGGWGGCEDPKLVRIGDRIYLTYVAFNGTWPERTAISSISIEDFRAQRWNWSEPHLLSPDYIGNKSACLLPEKIDGKYVIFHRVWPDIVVEYVDDLDFSDEDKWLSCTPSVYPWKQDGKVIMRHGTWPHITTEVTEYDDEYDLVESPRWKELTKDIKRIPARPDKWDSHKISMGASPLKTEQGWLALYSAVDRKDFSKYKIGAMLLDHKNPHKVIHRSERPIIIPDEHYENDGKPGIVYPGGAVIKDDQLLAYYGGGDKVSCVAHAPLTQFIDRLINDRPLSLSFEPVSL